MLIKLFKKSFFPPAILSFLLLLTYGAYHMFTCTRPSALQQNHPPCPVIKVSMLYGSRRSSQLEAALETHRKYSRRWGCEFAVLEQDLTPRKHFSKHYHLLSALLDELSKPPQERKEWLMWTDADTVILNPAIPPTLFLPPHNLDLDHVFAIVTTDHNGLNDGVFFLRVCGASLDLLTRVVDYPLARPDEDLGFNMEQNALSRVLDSTAERSREEGKKGGVAWVPYQWFNVYQKRDKGFEGQPGVFLVHFPGLRERKAGYMEAWLEELRANPSDWEVDVEETGLGGSVREFWDGFAADMGAGEKVDRMEMSI